MIRLQKRRRPSPRPRPTPYGFVPAAVLAFALAACTSQGSNTYDLEEVKGTPLEKIEVLVNVDEHPNVVRFCIDGMAFYSVSATQVAPHQAERITRVPEWDTTYCGAEPR